MRMRTEVGDFVVVIEQIEVVGYTVNTYRGGTRLTVFSQSFGDDWEDAVKYHCELVEMVAIQAEPPVQIGVESDAI